MLMTHETIVRAVKQQMAESGMTPYQLHVRLAGRVSKQTVYNFAKHGAVVNSDTLAAILDVLGLTIVAATGRAGKPSR